MFDEIEKAHPDVFNILLQILEDGLLTDSQGRKVDFKNTIIIMTSNVGASAITSRSGSLGFSAGNVTDRERMDREAARERLMSALRDTFRPEFLNRVDEIVVFHKLGDTEIRQIANIMIQEVLERVQALGITLTIEDAVIDDIAQKGVDPVYGARPLRREIQRRLEDSLSMALLDGSVKAGDHVRATLEKNGEIAYRCVTEAEESRT